MQRRLQHLMKFCKACESETIGGRERMLASLLNMIEVTRLNGKGFMLNALHIEQIESFPDTTITLANGKKFVVKEDEEQLQEKSFLSTEKSKSFH